MTQSDESYTTQAGVRVIAIQPDWTATNITEGVEAMYDLLVQSMDWGSGFLTVEEAVPVAKLAQTCGFVGAQQAEDYIRQTAYADGRVRFSKEQLAAMSIEEIERQMRGGQ